MDYMLGTITLFAGNFAPYGWAFCDGTVLNIQQNAALFSLISNCYGGDGKTTFALPDLRGYVPVGANYSGSTAPPSTKSRYILGQKVGNESYNGNVALTGGQLPAHTHPLADHAHSVGAHTHSINSSSNISFNVGIPANGDPGDTSVPVSNACFANGTAGGKNALIYNTKPSTLMMDSQSVNTSVNVTGNTGNNSAFNTQSGVTPDSKAFNVTGNNNVNTTTQVPFSADVRQCSLAINYIICVEGVYPNRP